MFEISTFRRVFLHAMGSCSWIVFPVHRKCLDPTDSPQKSNDFVGKLGTPDPQNKHTWLVVEPPI